MTKPSQHQLDILQGMFNSDIPLRCTVSTDDFLEHYNSNLGPDKHKVEKYTVCYHYTSEDYKFISQQTFLSMLEKGFIKCVNIDKEDNSIGVEEYRDYVLSDKAIRLVNHP